VYICIYIYVYIYIYMYIYIYCLENSGNCIFKFGTDAARPRSGIIRDSALYIPIAHRPARTKHLRSGGLYLRITIEFNL